MNIYALFYMKYITLEKNGSRDRGKYKSDFFLFRHDLFLGFLYFVMTDICNIFYLVANALFLIQYGHLRFFKLKLIKLTSRPF